MLTHDLHGGADDQPPIPLTAAEVLLLAADTIYGDPSETTPVGIRNARFVLDGILSAASAGGFPHEDTLRELLKTKYTKRHTAVLARAACKAAGFQALRKLFNQAGL